MPLLPRHSAAASSSSAVQDRPSIDKTNRSSPSKQVRTTRSWYGSGGRKSSASTQLARETILGGTLRPTATADLKRFDIKRPEEGSSGEATSPGSTTQVTNIAANEWGAVGDGQAIQMTREAETKSQEERLIRWHTANRVAANRPRRQPSEPGNQQTDTTPPGAPDPQPAPACHAKPHASTGGWMGTWFGRSAGVANAEVAKNEDVAAQPERPETPPPSAPLSTEGPAASSGGYWFGLWPSGAMPASEGATVEPAKQDAPPLDNSKPRPPKEGAAWAFWCRETASKAGELRRGLAETGQLAIMGESSESRPQRATPVAMDRSCNEKAKDASQQAVGRAGKPSASRCVQESKTTKRVSMAMDEPVAKTAPRNVVLPALRRTHRVREKPSLLRQVADLLLRTTSSPPNHVFLASETPTIRKALAIGVHGLFPAHYLRPMLGQPTGTSLKFANQGAEAIRRWTQAHGCDDCEIDKVALEGDGKIGERVENLWKLLLNWIDQIRRADLIMFVCHSQGVPVTVMLLAKLVELGVITAPRVGVCAMAGVSLGPFPDYRSSVAMLMGSAGELWDFANPESDCSQRLEAAIKVALGYGARITFVGSIDDPLVPLESALYSPAHHPYIYRAVFVDGRTHAPDFIACLVGLALKLRNLGISDHGLIRELSLPLAGSLVGGDGHSRLHDDDQVYDLALAHTLDTTDMGPRRHSVACKVHKFGGLANPNPYHLPWILRGLLEENFVKTQLGSETAELLRLFDDWKPTSKALKDVKYRLEAVRSKL